MVYKYFGFNKLFKVPGIIATNGGILKSIHKLFIQDGLKIGTLVGTDKFGNKYFENTYYFFGRSRWVEYSPHYGLEYDGSQIPAEWFGWLHYKTHHLPYHDPFRPKHKWMLDHTENLTGTPHQFMPYSTTRQKIVPWKPPKEDKEC